MCSLSGEQVDPVPKHFKYEENECKPHPSQPFRAGGLGRRREGGEKGEAGGTRSQVARGWKEAVGEAGWRADWS